jgi:hypothetical protein
MFQHRFVTRLIAATAVAIAFGVLKPARAQGLIVKNDPVLINGGTADFGSGGGHVVGTPTGSGFVTWEFSTINGSLVVNARVHGTLYLDSLDPGCARLTIEFKNRSGAVLTTRTKDVCVTTSGHNANDSTNQSRVDEQYASSHLEAVVLRTNAVVNDRVVMPGTSKTVDLPDSIRHPMIINNGNADFGGGGGHAGGTPVDFGAVELSRNDGNVTGGVSGALYYDSLFSEGCAQMIILFENSAGSTIRSETVKKCGPGGNANDPVNKKNVDETFTGGSLFKIRLRVGQVLPDGSFVRVQTKTCDFLECK